ncbi:hypothetical protein ACOMHN_005955 [Nucella lapillus]
MKRVKAVGVRLCLLLHFVLVVWRVVEAKSGWYWLMLVSICPFILESLFTVIRRNGIEWKMFSVCFFFYLAATLPGIWLLELYKTELYQSGNFSHVEELAFQGVEIPVRLTPDTWVLVVEELMLYLMILGRWMLPRGDVGREQLTQLLFGFIGIASDIMELFSLFDEDTHIRNDTILTYVILGVWTLSVLQFTLTFATAHRPRRTRGYRLSPYVLTRSKKIVLSESGEKADPEAEAKEFQRHRVSVMRMELLATFLSLFMQDGPFLGLRLYTMIRYKIITYSLVFFTAKNVLVILLLVYKTFLLLSKIFCPSRKNREDDEEDFTGEEVDMDFQKLVAGTQRKITPDSQESCILRKRREEERKDQEGGTVEENEDPEATFESVYLDQDMGALQKAIEGPATPAKNVVRGVKYKARGEAGEKDPGPSKDAQKNTGNGGVENPAFEPCPRTSGDEQSPSRKVSHASNKAPSRKQSRAQNEGPDMGTPYDWDTPGGEDPGRDEPLGPKDDPGWTTAPDQGGRPSSWNRPVGSEPLEQKTSPGMNEPLPPNGVPGKKAVGQNTPSGNSPPKRHVSVIKVAGTRC